MASITNTNCYRCGLSDTNLAKRSCGHIYCEKCVKEVVDNMRGEMELTERHFKAENENTFPNDTSSARSEGSIEIISFEDDDFQVVEAVQNDLQIKDKTTKTDEIQELEDEMKGLSEAVDFTNYEDEYQGTVNGKISEVENSCQQMGKTLDTLNRDYKLIRVQLKNLQINDLFHAEEKESIENCMDFKITSLQEEVKVVKDKLETITQQLTENQKVINDKVKMVEKDSCNIKYSQYNLTSMFTNQISNLEKSLNKTIDDKLDIVQKIQHELQEDLRWHKAEIATIRVKPNKTFMWKIKNFSTKQECGQKVYSNSFFITDFGYKMRLMMMPNGCGNHQMKELAIFTQILEGPYDVILNWPVQYNTVFTVLDPSKENKQNIFKLLNGIVGKNYECFDMPIGVNKFWGITNLISLDVLKSKYLIEDNLFIEVAITLLN